MGFGEVDWLDFLVHFHITFSVLINGTPAGFFNSSRGLLQDKGRSGDGVLVSHLLFADDTLVFCEASQDQMVYLSWLLMWFEAIQATTSYLDLPLGAHHKSVVWDGVEERFRKGLPWGCFGEEASSSKWDTVCLDKRKGGLGVRCLSTLNRALLCKWNWRFVNQRETLWRNVISRKYGRKKGIEAWLVELWDSSGEEGVWSPRFSRSFNDWEVERWRDYFDNPGRRLNLFWKIECCGKRLRMGYSS
ncbi:hypothetical protein CK203_054052 [Vitis vinifera]|uniref:Uncharacterized protein n=1 Tax=Vitis vinifera TaxID=29760 RepID=A0A438GIH1_VITVI|nr:hypothetical protein CK203_054052 [Vitis vinifera]